MKVEKKKITQATAVILAVILVLTGVCTGGFSNLYSLKRSIADGTDTTKEITAFDALSGSVSTQELAVGAKESDIVFPKELKATMVERKKVAATVNETKPASVDNNAQKEGTTVPAVNPGEAAPAQTPAQAPEGAAANPAEAAPEGATNPAATAPEGAQQRTPAQTPEGAANSTPAQTPEGTANSAPAASESAAPESMPAGTEGSSDTSGGSNAAENESTAPTNNDSSSESGNGLTGSVRKLTQIFALRNVQAEELTGTNAQTSASTTSGNETQTSASTASSTDTQTTENTSAASGETTTTTNAAGTETTTQTTTTGTDAQTTTGTPAETDGGTTDAAAVSTPETSVPTSEATTETTNNTIANPETPAAQPAASTVMVSESDKDKFETTTTQAITLSDISWRIDAGASSGSAFSSEKAGATFVYVPVISGDYTVSADLPRITVKIVDELRPAVELTQIVDGIKITLRAEKGVFPAGVTMSARRVTDYEEDNVENAVEEVRNETKNVVDSYTFDIKVLDKNGNEIQPDSSKGKVSVSFTMEEVTNDNLEADVYHIKGKELSMSAEELNEKTTNGDTVEAKTDGFSYYTVEFTYNDLQYVLPGGSAAPLSQILTTVGLTGTVSDARGSNPELFMVGKVAVQADGTTVKDALGNPIADENGVWYVVSKAAFSTDEWMKVTIGGVEYEIKVTDTQGQAIHNYAELKDTNAGSETQYYLANDIELNGIWEISKPLIQLDLNGYCIKAEDKGFKMISILYGRKLILTDSRPNAEHKFSDRENNSWVMDSNGSKTISGGLIYGGNDSGISNGGELQMTGGAIVGIGAPTSNAVCSLKNYGTATLENVTIAGNYTGGQGTAGYGGGIYNEGTLNMTACEIKGNKALHIGGGIYNHITATASLNNVTISDNTAGDRGGGIYNFNRMTITGGSIDHNSSKLDGGGIYNTRTGTAEITNAAISYNTSCTISSDANDYSGGGAIFNNCSMTVTNCTINNNTCQNKNGGAICNGYPDRDDTPRPVLNLNRCIIQNNQSNASAGALCNGYHSTVTMDGCTITGNTGAGNVGGVYIKRNGTVTVKDTTITNNTTTNGSEGGFYIEEDGNNAPTVNFEGRVEIHDNTCKNDDASNLCINRDGAVRISNQLTAGTHIGVTHRNGIGTITTGFQQTPASTYFTADDLFFRIDKDGSSGEVVLKMDYVVTLPSFDPNTYPIVDGQTLGEIALVGGSVMDGETEIPGTFSWMDPSIIPQLADSEQTEYYIVFTASNGGSDPLSFAEPTVVKILARINPVVAITGWKVGESPNAPSVTEGNPGIGDVTYSYKVKGAGDNTYSATVPTKAGEYTVKADVAQTANYAAGSATADFVIYQDTVETKTEAKDGAPTITVEGLSDVLTDADKSAAGTTNVYEVSFTADKKTESTAAGVPQIKALLASNQQLETLLDLTLYKTSTTLSSDSTKTITKTENIGGTNKKVLGLAIPYQTAGRTLLMLRFHGESAAKLTALGSKPTGGYTDGTYFIDTANNVIYVYGSGYSTYAIAVETASGGGDSGGGSSSGGSSGGSSSSSGSSGGSSLSNSNTNNNAQAAAAPAAPPAAQPAANNPAAVQPAAENATVQNTKANTAKKSNGTAETAADSGSPEETGTEDMTDDQPKADTDKTTMTAKVSANESKQTTSNTEAAPKKKNIGLGVLIFILLLVAAGGVILVATSNAGKRKNQ